jgi:hypothetical protein
MSAIHLLETTWNAILDWYDCHSPGCKQRKNERCVSVAGTTTLDLDIFMASDMEP